MRITHWLRPRPTVAAPAEPPQYSGAMTAMVALPEPVLPGEDAILGAAWRRWPQLPPIADVRREADVITFAIGGGRGVIGLAPLPIPDAHLDAACGASTTWWPDARERLRAHRAHLLLTVRAPELEPVDLGRHLTRLVASATRAAEGLGVLWTSAGVVRPPHAILQDADAIGRGHLPVRTWVGFHIHAHPDGTRSLTTAGLAAFGLLEVEVAHSWRGETELVERVRELVHELLDQRPVLAEAHITTDTHAVPLAARRRRSALDPRRMVYRVDD